MKTYLKLALCSILCLTVLVGCGGKETTSDEPPKDAKVVTLKDNIDGYEVSAYGVDSKDNKYEVEDKKLSDTKKKIVYEFYVDKCTKYSFNDGQKSKKEADDGKRYVVKKAEYNGYKGYSAVDTTKGSVDLRLLLGKTGIEKDQYFVLTVQIEGNFFDSLDAVKNLKKGQTVEDVYYKQEYVQNVLNSITYKKIEREKIDGVLDQDRVLGVRDLTKTSPDKTNFKVSQFKQSNGVETCYDYINGKYTESQISVRVGIVPGCTTLEEALARQESMGYTQLGEKKFADITVHLLKYKNGSEIDYNKFAHFDYGVFEKDGRAYDFLYVAYAECPDCEKNGEKLIKDVVDNMYIYKEKK